MTRAVDTDIRLHHNVPVNSMVTSAAVLQRTGIKNVKTLTRWHQLGLIPAPVVATHPNGRGKISWYEESVIDLILRIRRFVQLGRTLADAAKLAHQEARDHVLDETVRIGGREVAAAEAVQDEILRVARPLASGITDLAGRLRRADVVAQTTRLIQNGENPVLVITPYEIAVAPDYAISAALATAKWQPAARAPLLLVPLAFVFESLNLHVGKRGAFDYHVRPVNRVHVKGSRHGEFEGEIEHEVLPDSFWRGFCFAHPKSAKKLKRPRSNRKRKK